MGKTSIGWTEWTWNYLVGCTRVSEGCRNCYAMLMAARIANAAQAALRRGRELTDVQAAYRRVVRWERGRSDGPADDHDKALPEWNGRVEAIPSRLREPLRWKRPRLVFANSMSDVFHESVPFSTIDEMLAVMALCPQHVFQVLTKRPDRAAEYLNDCLRRTGAEPIQRAFELQRDELGGTPDARKWNEPAWPLPNFWLGCSVENQQAADERIGHLLRCLNAMPWISAEPLLGPVHLRAGHLFCRDCETDRTGGTYDRTPEPCRGDCPRLRWCVIGCESGHGRRPTEQAWAEDLAGQCVAAGVAVDVKQLEIGGRVSKDVDTFPESLRLRQSPVERASAC